MTNLETIKNLYTAFTNGDVPNVISAMHEKVEWNEAENFPYADNNPYIGTQAIVEGVFARCMTEWDGFAVNMQTFYDAGETIIATGRYEGKYKASGKDINPQAVHIWTFKHGEIVKFQQHIDTLNVYQAMK